ncbi:hypothetical protein ACFU6I_44935 [Streptomyces sp. NPDC057486]|uniref:hypothetical protein n=1 Tax=Streptomyces sp. NPDC057486 TaxID=3346145 RepID=UPI0036ADD3A2
MPRSTLITRASAAAALACAAVALVLVFARYDAPARRWDILAALGAATVAAGGWALACRTAPPLRTASPAAGQGTTYSPPPLPRKLPLPARDAGRATGAILIVLTPFTLTRLAAGTKGGILSGLLIILVFIVTVKALGFARRQVSQADIQRKLRVLAEDADRGELHAVRVRVGEPVRMRYLKRGSKPGELDVTQFHWLVLRKGEREVKLAAPPEEVGRAALRLGDQEGWLIWPERWKLIEAELPAAFVADSGEILMGLTDPDEAHPYLKGALHTAPGDRTIRRLPRTAKFQAPVHTPILGGALLAALLTAPVLYFGSDDMPAALSWLLCALAAAAIVIGAIRGTREATRSLPEGLSWTVVEESDPSIA